MYASLCGGVVSQRPRGEDPTLPSTLAGTSVRLEALTLKNESIKKPT